MALRYDIGGLRAPTRMDNGYLKVDGYLTRTGVFTYRNPDGSERKELRTPEEVFHADSLQSFSMVPVTDDHPPEMLNAQNSRKYQVGHVGESIRKDGDKVAGTLMITDGGTVSKMDGGKVQLSCGYDCDLDMTPGTYKGEKYDAIQRNIRGNHVALVQVGRAGENVRVRMDAAMMIESHNSVDSNEDLSMAAELNTSLIDALEKVAQLQVQLAAEKTRADSAEAQLKDSQAQTAAAKADADGLKAAALNAEKARKDAEESFAQRVQGRVALESQAKQILGEQDLANQSDRAIKLAVVKKVDSEDLAADAHDEYVQGRYVSAQKRYVKADTAIANVRVAAENAKPILDKEVEARKAMIERNRNAWKGTK